MDELQKNLIEAFTSYAQFTKLLEIDPEKAAAGLLGALTLNHITALFQAYVATSIALDDLKEAQEEIAALLDVARADTLTLIDRVFEPFTHMEVPA